VGSIGKYRHQCKPRFRCARHKYPLGISAHKRVDIRDRDLHLNFTARSALAIFELIEIERIRMSMEDHKRSRKSENARRFRVEHFRFVLTIHFVEQRLWELEIENRADHRLSRDVVKMMWEPFCMLTCKNYQNIKYQKSKIKMTD